MQGKKPGALSQPCPCPAWRQPERGQSQPPPWGWGTLPSGAQFCPVHLCCAGCPHLVPRAAALAAVWALELKHVQRRGSDKVRVLHLLFLARPIEHVNILANPPSLLRGCHQKGCVGAQPRPAHPLPCNPLQPLLGLALKASKLLPPP